ncbi:MAG: hypothetical protein Q9160_005985 [Pyrenula sp. 1 TL-2023]
MALSHPAAALHSFFNIEPHNTDGSNVSIPDIQPSFLRLPLEIRNEIYKLCLVQKETALYAGHPSEQISIALLQTCNQVYEETVPIFYLENTFPFSKRVTSAGDGSLKSILWDRHISNRLSTVRKWSFAIPIILEEEKLRFQPLQREKSTYAPDGKSTVHQEELSEALLWISNNTPRSEVQIRLFLD